MVKRYGYTTYRRHLLYRHLDLGRSWRESLYDSLLIHDNDLLSVINELRSAGAEAISLNGERILATSEVRCTGAVVTVNGRRYAAPYVVFAIGDPDTLYSALTMRNGVVDVLSQWGITVKVTASDQLLIPKYNGTVEYQYAKPIPADEGGEEAVG